MARAQPFTVACNGGLVKSANSIDLLRTPGVARELRNFEVSTEGGYRRINGFAKYGGGSAAKPTGGSTNILGVIPGIKNNYQYRQWLINNGNAVQRQNKKSACNQCSPCIEEAAQAPPQQKYLSEKNLNI